jgi:hypothetical protein
MPKIRGRLLSAPALAVERVAASDPSHPAVRAWQGLWANVKMRVAPPKRSRRIRWRDSAAPQSRRTRRRRGLISDEAAHCGFDSEGADQPRNAQVSPAASASPNFIEERLGGPERAGTS